MLAGMSDDLYFQVFYGSGEVRYSPEGVDLLEFSSIKKIPRAKERTWISISNWLFKAFAFNRDEHEISVMAVVSRGNQCFGSYCRLKGRKTGGIMLI